MTLPEPKMHPLTIFEGPDCSGKSTLANEFRKRRGMGTRLIHHGAYPRMNAALPRLYVEYMHPMLMGFEEQIWDRSWLSEPIYGQAFRSGADRIGVTARRHLERFAFRHGAVVVLCLPPFEAVKEKWLERKGEEYLDSVEQLEQVYHGYAQLAKATHLPIVVHDYTRHKEEPLWKEIARVRPSLHPHAYLRSGGNLNGPVVLVGEKPSDVTDYDTAFQLPFASFANNGCSRWLTDELERFGIREDQLLWVNADSGVHWLKDLHSRCVIALGDAASKALSQAEVHHATVTHPQHHKRFKSAEPYPLLALIDNHL